MKTRLTSISFLLILAFVVVTGINARMPVEYSLTVDRDPDLEIEAWMVQDDHWKPTSIEVIPETDETLELEQWMIDDHYFGNNMVGMTFDE